MRLVRRSAISVWRQSRKPRGSGQRKEVVDAEPQDAYPNLALRWFGTDTLTAKNVGKSAEARNPRTTRGPLRPKRERQWGRRLGRGGAAVGSAFRPAAPHCGRPLCSGRRRCGSARCAPDFGAGLNLRLLGVSGRRPHGEAGLRPPLRAVRDGLYTLRQSHIARSAVSRPTRGRCVRISPCA